MNPTLGLFFRHLCLRLRKMRLQEPTYHNYKYSIVFSLLKYCSKLIWNCFLITTLKKSDLLDDLYWNVFLSDRDTLQVNLLWFLPSVLINEWTEHFQMTFGSIHEIWVGMFQGSKWIIGIRPLRVLILEVVIYYLFGCSCFCLYGNMRIYINVVFPRSSSFRRSGTFRGVVV